MKNCWREEYGSGPNQKLCALVDEILAIDERDDEGLYYAYISRAYNTLCERTGLSVTHSMTDKVSLMFHIHDDILIEAATKVLAESKDKARKVLGLA